MYIYIFFAFIIHIIQKLTLALKSFAFKAYKNKAPNFVPEFMIHFTKIDTNHKSWYKFQVFILISRKSFSSA